MNDEILVPNFANMPKWHSHKIVQALKISNIRELEGSGGEVSRIVLSFHPWDEKEFDNLMLDQDTTRRLMGMMDEAMKRGRSRDDLGYYVLYPDGYQSWSPSAPFEAGYTPEKEY